MKKLASYIIILLIIGAGVYVWTADRPAPRDVLNGTEKTYSNTDLGVSFRYPAGYLLTEGDRGDGHRRLYVISLVRTEEATPPVNGEGPTGITLEFFQNNLDKLTLSDWLLSTNYSNFKLSYGNYASTTIDGEEAVAYRWSGLYEGETIAFLQKENVVALSRTYLEPSDHADSMNLIKKSLRLY